MCRVWTRAAAVAVLCALLAAPVSGEGAGVAVEGPNGISVGPFYVQAWSVGAVDASSFVMAYTELEDGNSRLLLGRFNVAGAALGPPTELYSGSVLPSWTHVAHLDSGADVAVWALRDAPIVSVVRGGVLETSDVLPVAGLASTSCRASEAGSLVIMACEMKGVLGTVEVYEYAYDPSSHSFDGPHLISPDDGVSSYLLDIAGTQSGHAWVVSTDWNPLQESGNALRLSFINQTGVSPSAILLNSIEGQGGLAAIHVQQDEGAVIAFATNLMGNGNAMIELWRVSQDLNAGSPAILSGGSGLIQTLGISPRQPDSEALSVVWVEASPAAPSPPGPGMGAAYWALIGADLGVRESARQLEVTIELPVLRTAEAGMLVSIGSTPSLIHISPAIMQGPPTAGQGAAASTWLVISIAVAGVGGAGFAAIFRGERFRYLAFLLLIPLYTHLRGERVMIDSMRRGAILQVISEKPGVRFSEISRRTGVRGGALTHHLRVLEEHGFVSRQGAARIMMFYPLGKNPIAEDPFTEIRERILGEIRKTPGIPHAALCKRLDMKWETGLYHIDVLKSEGKVRARRDRGKRKYWPLE